jgi:hypothetical protein
MNQKVVNRARNSNLASQIKNDIIYKKNITTRLININIILQNKLLHYFETSPHTMKML